MRSSSEVYGHTSLLGTSIPIPGIASDQQAALFGKVCTKPGMVKNTYGTGCFILMNTGTKPIASKNNLLTTVAWRIGDRTEYALEGSIFIAGAVVQWLRYGLEIISHPVTSKRWQRVLRIRAACISCPPSSYSARRTEISMLAAPSSV